MPGALFGIDEGIGDTGERLVSETSVLVDSAPGDEAALQPKKELILPPGVLGCFESVELADIARPLESIWSGGGRFDGGCRAILLSGGSPAGGESSTGIKGSLARRLWRGVASANE